MEYTEIQAAHPDFSVPTHLVVSREEAPAVGLTAGRFGGAQPAENRENRFWDQFLERASPHFEQKYMYI